MPEEINLESFLMGENIIFLDEMKKGKIVSSPPKLETDFVHYDVKNLRELMNEITKVYERGGSKKDFAKVIENQRKKANDEIHDAMSKLENLGKSEAFFKVVERKTTGNKITLTFEKINQVEKAKIIKSVIAKLLPKITQEQLATMLEQSLMKLNNLQDLKKVEKALDKKEPEIQGKRGCYKLVVEGVDVFLVG